MGTLYKLWTIVVTYAVLQSCGAIGCAGWSEGARRSVADGVGQAGRELADSPDLGTAVSKGAGVVALLATTALAEFLRRRNKRSDERKATLEKKVESLENGNS